MSKPVVVVVDDQLFVCETVETILKDTYEVHKFISGKEAMDYMSGRPVDLVLLDYDMPNMTGYEVLMAIRANKFNSKTPVVFLTAETNERMKKEMLERGASDYICKPIKSSELHNSIKKQLSC